MKFAQLALALVLLAAASIPAQGNSSMDCKERTDAMNVLTDVIFVRPVGFAGTLAGAALFAGLMPLTALASIPAPHDSFQKVGGVLVGVPYGYTFVRPLGEFANTCP